MAFASMFIIFMLFVIILLIGGMLIPGIILLIIGGVTKHKLQNRKYPKVLFGIGIALVALPVAIGIIVGSTVGYREAGRRISQLGYSSVKDKWKNTNFEINTNDSASKEAWEVIQKAAAQKNSETLKIMFADKILSDSSLETQINSFLKEFSQMENVKSSYILDIDYQDFKINQDFIGSYSFQMNGEYFYLTYGGCYQNEDSNEIGLKFLYLRNEKAYVLNDSAPENQYACVIKNNSNIITKRVEGAPVLFVKNGEKKLDESTVIAEMKDYERVRDLERNYGSPDAYYEKSNEIIYEMQSHNEKPLYLVIRVLSVDGNVSLEKIYSYHIVDDENNYSVWFNKDGTIQKRTDKTSENSEK